MTLLRRVVPNRWVRLVLAVGLLAVGGYLLSRQAGAYFKYRAARAELDRYKFAAAQKHLHDCLTVWSSRPDVWLLAGQTARRMEQYDEAERCYVEVQKWTGGVPQEDLLLERALLQAQLDPDSKESYLRSLAEANHPQTRLIFEAMVRGYLRRNRFKEAGFLVEKWLEVAPDDPHALFCRGWVREQLGPQVQAVEDYQRVLQIEPDHDEARLQLTKLLLEESRAAEALEVIRVLVAQHPDEPTALIALAEVQIELGELPAAEATARSALDFDPNSDGVRTVLGRVLIAADKLDEAEQHLRAAIRLNPSNYQAHQQLHRVLALGGRDQEARDLKATLDRMSKDITRLRAIFSNELYLSPRDPELLCEIGAIFVRAGELGKGVRWLEDALRVDPSHPQAHRELATAYEKLGDRRRADQHRAKAGSVGR